MTRHFCNDKTKPKTYVNSSWRTEQHPLRGGTSRSYRLHTPHGFTPKGSMTQGLMPHALPTAADVDAAAQRLAGVALRTPLITSPALDALTGARVFLKAETLQRTGSFQFPGAHNKPAHTAPERGARGPAAH